MTSKGGCFSVMESSHFFSFNFKLHTQGNLSNDRKSVLYQLIGKSEAPSFLFGTMHVRDKIAFTHLDKALNAMSYCTDFYAEMNLEKATELIQPTDYLMPSGMRLDTLIRPHQYLRMKKILMKSFDFDLDQMTQFYPMLIINHLTEMILSEDHAMPLDQYLWTHAKASSLGMHGIETVAEQMDTLHKLDISVQVKMLKDLCRNVSAFRSNIYQLVDKYLHGDIQSIYKISKKGLSSLKEPLLYTRNHRMAERIILHQEHASFYAIGAAHLAGAQGVLNLLKQRGMKVIAL